MESFEESVIKNSNGNCKKRKPRSIAGAPHASIESAAAGVAAAESNGVQILEGNGEIAVVAAVGESLLKKIRRPDEMAEGRKSFD